MMTIVPQATGPKLGEVGQVEPEVTVIVVMVTVIVVTVIVVTVMVIVSQGPGQKPGRSWSGGTRDGGLADRERCG